MIAQISGSRDGIMWPAPGEEINVPKEEAEALIQAGLAQRPNAPEENAMLDSHPETATVSGNKAVNAEARLAEKPAPHADEADAYHAPELPGERAAAEAGQAAVDEGNKARAEADAPKASPRASTRGKAAGK